MVQSPSWEANWFAGSQEIPHISRNPKVHYRTHKHPPPVAILGQPNPVHIPTSHLLDIRPNIIHPSTPRSHQWSPSLRFPHQDPVHPPLLTHTRHMPSLSHSSWFYHPHNIGWGEQHRNKIWKRYIISEHARTHAPVTSHELSFWTLYSCLYVFIPLSALTRQYHNDAFWLQPSNPPATFRPLFQTTYYVIAVLPLCAVSRELHDCKLRETKSSAVGIANSGWAFCAGA